jgi:UDP-N-acetylglucosamine diphosphorylase / glucose-1-phosphate thymidylyltransferase / UDP-N-acetylgalactosamine diphosphorylase / glucosamine-1-phosphate N-acetyltransferase / galactosamine-1-phosphate N-acetyltransferase
MTLAILLCAGKSTRTYPLTLTRPKALLPIANRPLIEYTLDTLNEHVDEVLFVVGYRKEDIKEHLGHKYKDLKIRYVEQKEQLGTGHALLSAKEYINDRVIVLNGDDIYAPEDIATLLKEQAAILCKHVDNPERFGVVFLEKGNAVRIVEKPKDPPSNLANIGAYVFPKEVISALEKVKKSSRGEYEITDVVEVLAKERSVKAIESKGYYLSIGYSWDLLSANKFFVSQMKKSVIKGKVEKGAVITGTVTIGEGTVVRAGSYINGPAVIGENCSIGPNCFIRSNTTIGNNCKVGHAVEVKNSIFFDGVSAGHLSYIGDSVVGEGVNLGAGTITANLRHDDKPITTQLDGKKIETGLRKLGCIFGDYVHTGIHTSLYPGRKLWPHSITRPGEIVEKDKVH